MRSRISVSIPAQSHIVTTNPVENSHDEKNSSLEILFRIEENATVSQYCSSLVGMMGRDPIRMEVSYLKFFTRIIRG